MMDEAQTLSLFTDADGDLTTPEQEQLTRLEETVAQGLNTFVDVGTALMVIRDSKLYRQSHDTFEDYCRDRWHMGKSRVYQMIDAATVVDNLQKSKILDFPPNESQARALSTLPAEVQREVYDKAVETAPNGKVTAAHVQRVVDEYDEQAEELSEDEAAYDWSEEDPPTIRPIAPRQDIEDGPTGNARDHRLAVHFTSDTPEHYTPREIIDAVLACMGNIDLDPCSNSKTEPNVPADFHYTIEDDGLTQVWQGRVYMNPPYGREIGKWVSKLCAEYEAGNVSEAIALVPARTDTDWFDQLIDDYKFHCFVHGRLQFIGNDGNAPFPSAIVYLGTEWGSFYNAFRSFGRIVQETNPEMFGA